MINRTNYRSSASEDGEKAEDSEGGDGGEDQATEEPTEEAVTEEQEAAIDEKPPQPLPPLTFYKYV